MDPRIAPLAGMLRLNDKLFDNCLKDLTEDQGKLRPSAATNHATFVAGHLVESRYFLLKLLGTPAPSPLERYLGQWKGIDEITEWPPLPAIAAACRESSAALAARLQAMTPAELDAASDTPMSAEDPSVLGTLMFLVQHDSYHIGQLSLLRKYAGLPAMSYN